LNAEKIISEPALESVVEVKVPEEVVVPQIDL
jgi:hypothetical protein